MRALQKLYDKGVSIKRPRAVTVCVLAPCVWVFAGVDEEGEEAVSENRFRFRPETGLGLDPRPA